MGNISELTAAVQNAETLLEMAKTPNNPAFQETAAELIRTLAGQLLDLRKDHDAS